MGRSRRPAAARGRSDVGHQRRQATRGAGRPVRRLVCGGRGRAGVPQADQGEAAMSVPKSFAGLPLESSDWAMAWTDEQPTPWLSPEGIEIKTCYDEGDVAGLDALDTWPGLSPFLRG